MTGSAAQQAAPAAAGTGRGRLLPYLLATAVAAFGTLVVVLVVGGGAPRPSLEGLPSPGPVTDFGLPLLRLTGQVAGVVTIGLLLCAAVLLPGRDGNVSGAALRGLRVATVIAIVWAVAAAGAIVFTLSDFLGQSPAGALKVEHLKSFVQVTAQGRALVIQLGLVALVALGAPWILTRRSAFVVTAVAMAAMVAPTMAGHAASIDDHTLAVSTLLVHVAAVALWVGGLAGIGIVGRRDNGVLPVAVPRFSHLAAWCLVLVALSGLVNAWLEVRSPGRLVTTAYGALVIAKVVALGWLGWLGWRHRQRSLPALRDGSADGRFAVFGRIAAVELVVMAGTMALAVGLGRTPPAIPHGLEDMQASPARLLLGYDLPPPPTVARLLFDARPDALVITAIGLAAALYITGVRVLRRRGDSWPLGRTLAWFGGLAVALVVTCGGLARYSQVLFSVHMVQHMVLSMVVPLLLVLGAPITLALRTLPGGRDDPGPRGALLSVLHSRPVQVLAHPVVAGVLFVASLYGLYFTPLFSAAMPEHWGHLAMQLHFVLAGGLFFWVLIGVDPGPSRPPHLFRVLMLFIAMAFHAFFSIALMSTPVVLAGTYYAQLQRPWGASALDDQRLGAGIGWAFGDVPIVLVLIVLFIQWSRADDRAARAADRAADRAAGGSADPLTAYNEYLAGLGRADRSAQQAQGAEEKP